MTDYNKLYQVSNSYAQALFESVLDNSKREQVFSQFIILNDLITDPTIAKIFARKFLSTELSKKFLDLIQANLKLDLTLKNLICLLINNNKLAILSHIFQCFKKLVLNAQNQKELTITFANSNDLKLKTKITAQLEEISKTKFVVQTEINQDLLAGFTLQIDSMFFDASLDNTLKKYQKNILNKISAF